MQRKAISWILDFTNKLPEVEMVKCLAANPGVSQVLKYAFDPDIKWLLPDTDPPYTPCDYPNMDNEFYGQLKKLYLFVEGGNDDLPNLKRERLFIDMLESIHQDDAILLLAIKNKTLPYENITPKIVLKAFPGLFRG